MTSPRVVRHLLVAIAAAVLLPWGTQVMQGQAGPADPNGSIPSLSEPGESLAIKSTSRKTGFATFAATPGRGILLPQQANAAAEERALGFVDLYGARFGLASRAQVRMLRAPRTDELGVEHVRLQQVYNGIPVTGGEFLVHLKGSRVTAANGLVLDSMPGSVIPGITAAAAQDEARKMITKYKPAAAATAQYSDPQLEIFNKGVLAKGTYPSRLAWFVEARDTALRQFIWIDAQSGAVLMQFSQLADALSRTVYTANSTTTLPGTLLRTEGGPATGDADADNAYLYAGITYNYYFVNQGRDSYNNAGAGLVSTVHACRADECPMANAFWNGTQMVYGNTYASADDVVAHELTHAVTEYSAHLLYYNQSGALNESFSDIFGETVDQLSSSGGGNDGAAARWYMGEDLPIGAIRNMMNPGAFGDPARVGEFGCVEDAWTNPSGDSGGVHSNSGIPNHAYALMVDGGSYNGQTITGIGLAKAAKIEYRALTVYLTSGSGFLDDFNALNQACTDLIGTIGITAADCTQVNKALLAVEMNAQLPCAGAANAPALCTTGVPAFLFNDGFEGVTANWTTSTTGAGTWTASDVDFARSGTHQAFGSDAPSPSDSKLAMNLNIPLPANARMYFDHAYEFENDGFDFTYFDGGKLEYSINSGGSWVDANSLIDGGRNYSGTISASDSSGIAGQAAFVGSSYGYTGTRLNLASLAGQNVRFRFRIVSDPLAGSFGWVLDNVGIYTCTTGTAPVVTTHPSNQTKTAGQTASFTAAATGSPVPTVQWQVSVGGGAFTNIGGATSTTYSFATVLGDNGKAFRAVFSNTNGTAITNPATLTVNPVPSIGSLSITVGGLPGGTSAGVQVTGPGGFNSSYLILTGTGVNLSDVTAGSYTVTPAAVSLGGPQYNAPVQVVSVPAGGNATANVVYTQQSSAPLDFDGDGKSDMGLYKPNGDWAILKSTGGFTSSLVRNFGGAGYVPVLGDYDGDGKQDLALYRSATGDWLVLKSSTSYTTSLAVNWGGVGYVPVRGDYDGDGKGDLGIYRPSTGQWSILKSSSGFTSTISVNWGGAGYTPIPGQDFDGDHMADIALYSQATGQWLILKSSTGYTTTISVGWGGNGYTLVPGDYDGDGKADMGLYERSTGRWLVLKSGAGYTTTLNIGWGGAGYLPVPGDFDGDGKIDLGIFQQSTGNWFALRSSTAYSSTVSASGWGTGADTPLSSAISLGGNDTTRASDFDGDGRSDVTVYHTSGNWLTLNSSTGFTTSAIRSWGGAGYAPVPGDYDGDGKGDYAIYQQSSGNWYVLLSGAGFTTSLTKNVGGAGWVPVAGDYDGDGKTDLVVYNTSTGLWYGLKSSSNYTTTVNISWGGAGYAAAPGDYDGDGKSDLAVYQGSSGNWLVLFSGSNFTTSLTKNAGGAGYVAVPGDYDGDGKTDLAVYNTTTGLWYALKSSSGYTTTLNVGWGGTGYAPVRGDFDGDGKADLAIYNVSTGVWSVLLSGANYTTTLSKSWGGSGYVPVPSFLS